ncbi:MAG: sugar phosphate isomerase/epimerase [Planctomycetes bacterium]|nr:sugar phosphate isomerase/epimerase [Planctomycetota bacterium]
MRLGYNTNGFPHHDLRDCLAILSEIGYASVALTLDHHALNPFDADIAFQVADVRRRLREYGMASFVETGARYLLDPRRKHQPTLLSARSEDRSRRVDFLRRAIDIAADLESGGVSLWSGAADDDATGPRALDRLCGTLEPVLEHAERRGVVLGFEPEPGMVIATLADFEKLLGRLDSPRLQLTMDVGHLHCQEEEPIPDRIEAWRDRIVNIHVEDMRRGTHEHLMFGEGDMEFGPILAALRRIDYQGGMHVELSRHGHAAPDAARRAYAFLQPLVAIEDRA